MYRPLVPPTQRKGIILLVVLALLTLFTIVGISFVLYADAAATQARVAKDSNVNLRPEMEAEEGLSLFLDQFIFGCRDDESGVYSSVRGHELVRSMYGFNYTWADIANPALAGTPGLITQVGNDTPFSGIGRLHYPYQGPTALTDPITGGPVDDWKLINYMYYQSDGFVRDPERYPSFRTPATATSLRTPGTDNRGVYLASANVPYTYPDLNNFYLAAINSYGTLITPSFHREWLFGRLDAYPGNLNGPNGTPLPVNPNWGVNPDGTRNNVGKYLTVRPRPLDNALDPSGNPLFPYPGDRGGDVKNLIGYPGGNDSPWIDIGAPVRTTPGGKKYKMLIAPLILDLDGRINLNVHGNIAGKDSSIPLALPNGPHISKEGLGAWEVNLGQVLTASNGSEWPNLFTGATSPMRIGRYGPQPQTVPLPPNVIPSGPPSTNNLALPGLLPTTGGYNGFHYYGQIDYRGQAQGPLVMPGLGSTFPFYQKTYHNSDSTDLQNHPVLYNPFSPAPPNANSPGSYYNRRFRTSNLERLFRWGNLGTIAQNQPGPLSGDTGLEALTSDVERLLQMNLNDPSKPGNRSTSTQLLTPFERRNLVTLLSGDRLQPGMSPYVFTSTPPTPVTTTAAATQAPQWTTPPVFPPLAQAAGGDFTQYWQAAPISSSATGGQTLWRLDLNNPFNIPSYVPASVAALPANRPATAPSYLTPYPIVKNATTVDQQRFDQDTYVATFLQAQSDRQWLARQIYLRLLAVTGLPAYAGNPPSASDLQVRRWYGQLAVNMVDYLDNDDISTPFNFYSSLDVPSGQPGLVLNTPASSNNDPGALQLTNPAYWVFGTEMPRVVLNEALIEYTPAPATPAPVAGTTNFSNNVWVELYNPLDNAASNTTVGNSNVTGVDQSPVPLAMQLLPPTSQSGGPNGAPQNPSAYAAYQVVIADMLLPMTVTGTSPTNDNVLGLPNTTRAATGLADFQAGTVQTLTATNTPQPVNNPSCPSACLPPQQYLVLGPAPFQLGQGPPSFQDFHSTMGVKTATFPNGLLSANSTQILPTPNMQYTSTYNTATTFLPNDTATGGQTIMLRRLVNPHIPFNNSPNLPGQPTVANPWYNPYVTIDYIQSIPLTNTTTAGKWTSYGKRQPYASANPATNSPVAKQINSAALFTIHTFGQQNNPVPNNNSGPNAWLTHLDRQLTSPLELLHVSQYQPHQLTQQFMLADPWVTYPSLGVSQTGYMHAPLSTWYNQNTRLYRLFELLQTNYQLYGSTDALRSTGKINLNSIWDIDTFMALCDPQVGNAFSAGDVQNVWAQLIQLRSPNYNPNTNPPQGVVGPTNIAQSQLANPNTPLDWPFLGLAPGVTSISSQQYPPQQNPQQQTQGIANTIFRPSTTTPGYQMFDNVTPPDNPYMRTELMRKIFNNTTSRSNVFAVWVTIGFFEVPPTWNGTSLPAPLGAEMNAAEGRQIRHRMFAIVDRSVLQNNPYATAPVQKQPFRPGAPPAGLTNVVPYWAIIE